MVFIISVFSLHQAQLGCASTIADNIDSKRRPGTIFFTLSCKFILCAGMDSNFHNTLRFRVFCFEFSEITHVILQIQSANVP